MTDPPSHRAASFRPRALEYYPRLQRVQAHLMQHLSRPFTAGEAARIAGLNPNYFSTFFHDKVGLRFTEWVRRVRIERAKLLLPGEGRSIVDVAREVGFGGRRAFERAFRRQTSMTPAAYRRCARQALRVRAMDATRDATALVEKGRRVP